jgi:hypothetical protein
MNGAIYRRKSTKGVSAIAAAPWDWIDRDLIGRVTRAPHSVLRQTIKAMNPSSVHPRLNLDERGCPLLDAEFYCGGH